MTTLRLQVQNLAVVENAEVEFHSGLNVVTGETGAGKSVLIGALALLAGSRADHGVIRGGAQRAAVSAEILVPAEILDEIAPILNEAGIAPCEDNLLILSRSVSAAGASRCSINNCPATAGTLSRVGEYLIDMHGPHDNQSLLSRKFQLDAVDSYGHCREQREKFRTFWRKRAELIAKKEKLLGNSVSAAAEADMLRYRINEIKALDLSEEHDGDALVAEYTAAANSARIIELGSHILTLLSESDDSVVNRIAEAARMIDELHSLSAPDAASWMSEIRESSIRLSELSRAVSDTVSRIDVSPERMTWLEKRMSDVERVKSKYGKNIHEVIVFLENAEKRLDELESIEQRVGETDAEIAKLNTQMREVGTELSNRRKQAAMAFSAAVETQLSELGLPRAGFSVQFSEEENENGLDGIEFMFAPNPGEPPARLRAIASSGEISRVMLALKTVLAGHDRIPVLIFDEIDANIGGEIAVAVGRKLRAAAVNRTVICITHLPQVASCGARHFRVLKKNTEDRVSASINEITGGERENEIARMLGGAYLTSVTLEHAKELLDVVNVRST